jgi:predicted GNAT family N-acyltransferase
MKNINVVKWVDHKQVLQEIRTEVFIKEQSVPENEEWDEYDEAPDTIHLLAFDDAKPVGTLRVIEERDNKFKITRLSVLQGHRSKGIAADLMRSALAQIVSKPFKTLYLHAQLEARHLYERFGFHGEDDIFLEAGIKHQKMVFSCSDRSIFAKLFSDNIIRLTDTDAFTQHAIHQINTARRKLYISSKKLRDDIFSDASFIEALSSFARRDRDAELNILLHEKLPTGVRSIPAVNLAHKLSSKIKIKVLTDEVRDVESFICSDSESLVFFNSEDSSPQGFACYKAKQESGELVDKFKHLWDHCAERDPNLEYISL